MRGLALALAIIGLVAAVALVERPTAVAQQGENAARRGSLKMCRATNSSGRQVSWGCSSDQRCCFNEATDLGYCAPAGRGC